MSCGFSLIIWANCSAKGADKKKGREAANELAKAHVRTVLWELSSRHMPYVTQHATCRVGLVPKLGKLRQSPHVTPPHTPPELPTSAHCTSIGSSAARTCACVSFFASRACWICFFSSLLTRSCSKVSVSFSSLTAAELNACGSDTGKKHMYQL